MPGPDRDADRATEDLLKATERAEAQAFRDDLLALLQSDACRSALEEIVRTPLEATVTAALNHQLLQKSFRDQLMASLKPELEAAVKTSVGQALKTIAVELKPDQEQRLMAQGQNAFETAVKQAQANAAKDITKAIADLRSQLLKEVEKVRPPVAPGKREDPSGTLRSPLDALPSALPSGVTPAWAEGDVPDAADATHDVEEDGDDWFGPFSWRMASRWAAAVVVFAALAYGAVEAAKWVYTVSTSSPTTTTTSTPEAPADAKDKTASVAPAAPGVSDATRRADHVATVLTTYRTAVLIADKAIPAVTEAQVRCVDAVSGGASLELESLRTAMKNCSGLRAPPSKSTQLVAYVQRLIVKDAARCPAFTPPTISGFGGGKTDKAIATYLGCIKSRSVWSSPTLGDYAALGIHLTERHVQ